MVAKFRWFRTAWSSLQTFAMLWSTAKYLKVLVSSLSLLYQWFFSLLYSFISLSSLAVSSEFFQLISTETTIGRKIGLHMLRSKSTFLQWFMSYFSMLFSLSHFGFLYIAHLYGSHKCIEIRLKIAGKLHHFHTLLQLKFKFYTFLCILRP